MRILIIRTAMAGGGLAYRGLVPAKEVVPALPVGYVRTIHDGATYFDFAFAALPADHHAIKPSFEKLEIYNAHEKWAHSELLKIAKGVYPELSHIRKWPSLWLFDLCIDEVSDKRWTTWEKPARAKETHARGL